MATKTNAVRLVQQAKIKCREEFYDFDPDDLNGMHVADAIGFPPEQVYKTLVAKGSRTGINVFCIPVCAELDLKKAAKVAADKDMAYLSRELGTICREVPLDLDLDNYRFSERDTAAVVALMAELELFSIIEKMGLSARACTRIIKLARTIADLAGSPDILPVHLSEAASYRFLDKENILG